MPSSTSNSNDRIPPAPYAKQWGLTLLFVLASLIFLEILLRSQGHQPNVIDNADLWSSVRRKASKERGSKIAVVGTSRALLGIVPDVLEDKMPGSTVYHLPINGSWPYATLKDLADDGFDGLVIVECAAPFATTEKARGSQQSFVDHYHRTYGNLGYLQQEFNRSVATALQSRLAVWSAFSNPYSLITKRFPPRPYYMKTWPNRWRAAHYEQRTPKDLAFHRKRRIRRAGSFEPTPEWSRGQSEAWETQLEILAGFVNKIQERGGDVVFVRMPTAPEIWTLDDRNYPRASYWDKLGPATGAATFHFQDYPVTAQIESPDGSHLNPKGAVKFTEALAEFLVKRASDQARGSTVGP